MVSNEFKGGEINAIFGGYELDLREATISKDGAKLSVNAVFGGAEVFVPKNCRVVTNGSGVFGGWDPNVKPNDVKNPVLEITGSAVFGGVEIKD
ncbi:MAG: LiaF domain-containing protein [Candidatus Dojkabacteria bacterium]